MHVDTCRVPPMYSCLVGRSVRRSVGAMNVLSRRVEWSGAQDRTGQDRSTGIYRHEEGAAVIEHECDKYAQERSVKRVSRSALNFFI